MLPSHPEPQHRVLSASSIRYGWLAILTPSPAGDLLGDRITLNPSIGVTHVPSQLRSMSSKT